MYRQHYPDDPGLHNDPRHQHSTPLYYSNPGFCDRVKANLPNIIIGMLIICFAVGILFWNEGTAVRTARALQEGLDSVHELHNKEVAFEHLNGKLVHITGPLRIDTPIKDGEYGVVVNAARLHRDVEMYQWYEEESTREVDDGDQKRTETSYSYYTDWRRELIRSSDFNIAPGHHNPDAFPVHSEYFQADNVHVGNFRLSKDLVRKITNWKRVTLNDPSNDDDPLVNLHQGMFYHGKSPVNPEVGDVRVIFEYAGASLSDKEEGGNPDEVSVIAKQHGSLLTTYETEAGENLEMLYMGNQTPQKIFHQEMSQNVIMMWGIRLGGIFVMFLGFTCLTRFLTSYAHSVPAVRQLVILGVPTFNLTLAIVLSTTIVALSWIWFRPWFGLSILALSLIPFILSYIKWRSRRRTDYFDRRSLYD